LFLQSCDKRVYPTLRLDNGQSRFKAGDRCRNIAPIAGWVIKHGRTVKTRCGPDVDVPFCGRSPRSVKTRWHDAGDPIQVSVEPYTPTQYIGVTPEQALPETVADENFLHHTWRVIFRIESPAQLGPRAQKRKIIWCDDEQVRGRRLRRTRKIIFVVPCRRNVLEYAGVLEVLPLRLIQPHIPGARARNIILNADELLRL